MRLLFDQPFSHSLPEMIQQHFPNSAQVHSLGFGHVSDDEIWWYARRHEFTLVSSEVDFAERSSLYHAPPKVIWFRGSHWTPSAIASLLQNQAAEILRFGEDPQARCLEYFLNPPTPARAESEVVHSLPEVEGAEMSVKGSS